MTDVQAVPKLTGPVDELRQLTIDDFRRLSKDPREATLKIKDKIDLLEDMGYEQKTQGVKAFLESGVNRLYLEKVNGRLQGAAFPFRQGFGSGNVPMLMTKSGALFVAGTNRGWGSRGTAPHALDRVTWSGRVPFEIHEMRARSDGFELTFTQPVDPKTAGDHASYTMKAYTYIFQSAYGSPEVDKSNPAITRAVVSKDAKSVRLYVDGLVEGNIHELSATGVRSAAGLPLLHKDAYYTLNVIPAR